MTFSDKPIKFQVITKDLSIPVMGILGVDFLQAESSEISFHHNALITSSPSIMPVKFVNYEHGTPVPVESTLKARTRMPILIKLQPTNPTRGYLPRIKTPEKIFIGSAVVTNKGQKCCVMEVNALEEDVEIEIPPQEIGPFEITEDESEDFFDSDGTESELINPEHRLEDIIESLRLDHSNAEEREPIIPIIAEYPEIFHLPGDELSATDILQHTISTTDEAPIFVKQYR